MFKLWWCDLTISTILSVELGDLFVYSLRTNPPYLNVFPKFTNEIEYLKKYVMIGLFIFAYHNYRSA